MRSGGIWGRTARRCLALALMVAFVAGCRQSAATATDEAPDVQMTLAAVPEQHVVGSSQLALTLLDAAGRPIDGATDVRLRGDMSHAGMEPVLATASAAGDGRYVADFEWTMAGDWFVTVEATLPDGRVKSARFDLSVAPD